jgi:DNA-directed RNA polymerase specialized sigma24 family protein
MGRRGKARRTDPETSHAAAVQLDAEALEERVLDCVRGSGIWGLTTEEIADALGIPRDSVSPRMPSLVRRRKVKEFGRRPNRSGRSAIVWVAPKDTP